MQQITDGARSGTRRVAYLDGIRALAVLAVFLTHSSEALRKYALPGFSVVDIAQSLNLGRVGVVTFFALSGFLIPSSLRGERRTGATRFLISRWARLFPAFWVSIIPAVLVHVFMEAKPTSWSELAANFTMLPEFLGFTPQNGGYWTLEIELLFYGICLFLFIGNLLSSTYLLATIMGLTFLVFYSSQHSLLGGKLNPALTAGSFFLNLHLSIMFWGAVFRRWRDGERLEPVPALLFWGYTAFWGAYMPARAMWVLWQGKPHPGIDLFLISGYSIGILIFFFGVLARSPAMPVLAWLGRISYSFYLLHGPCIDIVNGIIRRFGWLNGARLEAYVFACFVLSLVAATACYYLVEVPAIALGKRLTQRLAAGAAGVKLQAGLARLGAQP
jgi:peptidoglycan/LPS O-acetylase OafA/YrhL